MTRGNISDGIWRFVAFCRYILHNLWALGVLPRAALGYGQDSQETQAQSYDDVIVRLGDSQGMGVVPNYMDSSPPPSNLVESDHLIQWHVMYINNITNNSMIPCYSPALGPGQVWKLLVRVLVGVLVGF